MGVWVYFGTVAVVLIILELFFGCGRRELPRYGEDDPEDFWEDR